MRHALILLAFSLLAWSQPELAQAQRVAKAKTAKVQKAKGKLGVRSAMRATGRGIRSTGKAIAAPFKMRAAIRSQKAEAKGALKAGQLSAAAKTATRDTARNSQGQFVKGANKPLSFRERFAVWRMKRSVKKAAFKAAKQRSKKGNVEGTADALNALKTFEAKGQLGGFARWKANRITKKVMKNMRKSAKRSYKQGDVAGAEAAVVFGLNLKPGSKAEAKFAKQTIKDAFSVAKSYAKNGQGSATHEVLSMAAAVAAQTGAAFKEKQANKLIQKAFQNAVPNLTKGAKQAYKRGQVEQATAMLAEARQIQASGQVKVSRSTKRTQANLVKKLGPTLTSFEAAQAQAQLQAQ